MNNVERYYNQRVAHSDDLFYQVGKTVNGQPIDANQFDLIVNGISTALALTGDDLIADFGCGNALITNVIAAQVKTIVGVERHQALYEQASQHISHTNISLIQADILCEGKEALAINKAYSYEVIQHLSHSQVVTFVSQLVDMLPQDGMIFLGGIPDEKRKWDFYNSESRLSGLAEHLLEQGSDPVGNWFISEFFQALAEKLSLSCEIMMQPPALYTAHYRFDVLLRINK